jgi:hypothetical protein
MLLNKIEREKINSISCLAYGSTLIVSFFVFTSSPQIAMLLKVIHEVTISNRIQVNGFVYLSFLFISV